MYKELIKEDRPISDKSSSRSNKNGSPSHRVKMVDIGAKPVTERAAEARGRVRMSPATLQCIREGRIEKGDVLVVAQVAGIMAAKKTPEILPLCHPLLIEHIKVEFKLVDEPASVEIRASATASGKTGMEMEALMAVAASALTIYDMCKPVDPGMVLEEIRLVRKSGGKSGTVVLIDD